MPGRRFSSPEDPIGRRRTTVSSRSTSDHEESLIDLEIRHSPAKLSPFERKQAVPDPQPRKRPETNEFSTMSGFRLEPFSGHRSEDVETFIRICAHDFRRMASLYDDNDGEKEQARLDYLYSYTTGEARKWMSTLPRDVRSSWERTTTEMKKQFPLALPIQSKRSAWKSLNELKQNGQPLEEYFQDARSIFAQLHEHEHEVADQVIDGLDSVTIQESVGAHVGEGPYILEDVLHSIRSASRDKNYSKKDKDDPLEEKLRDAEPSRELLRYLLKQSENEEKKEAVLAGLVEQFNRGMNLNAGPGPAYNQRNLGRGQYNGAIENRMPGPNRVSFNMDSAVCYRCGQTGHIRPKCTNPPLAEVEQERLKNATGDRRLLRPDAGNGFRTQDNRSRPMGVAQAEVWHQQDEADYWTPGDRDMQVHQAHSVEVCETTYRQTSKDTSDLLRVAGVNQVEEVNAAGEKRTAQEAGMDASQMSGATVGRGSIRVPRPPRPKPDQKLVKPATRAKPTRRPIQGMDHSSSFNAAEALRNTTVTMSWMELADIAPQVRVQLGQAMRLAKPADAPTRPARPTKAPTRAATQAAMANLRPLAQPRPARFQAINTQETSAVQMLPHVPSTKRTTLSQQAKNFYTQGLVYPRRSTTIPLHLGQILIDAGSSVNLISEQIVMDMDIPQIPDCTLAIKVANGRVQQLHAFVRIKLVIASVEQILEAYVIPGSTSSYHLLLSRQWLRDVKAIGNYATDEYWITDQQGTTHPLIPTSIAHQQSINIPKVTLSAQAELSDCRLDEATLSDLEQEPEDMGGAIWDEVIKEAEEEDDCDYESDSTDGPSGKGESW